MKKFVIISFLIFVVFNCFGQKNNNQKHTRVEEVYGARMSCGVGGLSPKLREELDVLIGQKDYKTIRSWLNSSSLVRQVYAAESFIWLNNEGELILSDGELLKIAKLKKSNKKISTCSGCIYFSQKIKDVLANFEIEIK